MMSTTKTKLFQFFSIKRYTIVMIGFKFFCPFGFLLAMLTFAAKNFTL